MLPMWASMSGLSFEVSSRFRGSTLAVPPTSRRVRASVWTTVSCLWMIAPPLTRLHVRKCVSEFDVFPHMHCVMAKALSSLRPKRRRFVILHALLLRMLTPICAGICNCVAFGAEHETSIEIVDVCADVVRFLYTN